MLPKEAEDSRRAPVGGPEGERSGRYLTRRRVLEFTLAGGAAIVGLGAVAFELVNHGVVPGKTALDQIDGACDVSSPQVTFSPAGPSTSGSFHSRARNRMVGYTLAYPPGYRVGDRLPLIVALHAYGGSHARPLEGVSPAQALALRPGGKPLRPMAIVSADGGNGYWNGHPGDDPMSMIVDEIIPMCQNLGLGGPGHGIATMGISMGGYGALLLAERYPALISAAAAISPAIWTTYRQARTANAGAYATAGDFTADDVVSHAQNLAHTGVRVASGKDDPFYPGVAALARALPPGAIVQLSHGCHTAPFFRAQQPPSLQFLSDHFSEPV